MRIIIESPQPGDEDVVIVRCSSPDQRLISLLLSFGADLEVLAPASLRQMIAKAIRAMNQKYPDEEE